MTETTRPTVRVHLPHLLEWRVSRLLSQRQLARDARIAVGTVVSMERGYHQANTKTIRALSAALGVTPHELIYSTPAMPEEKIA